MARNRKNNDDISMDEFMSDNSSNIAVEDFAIEADETGTIPDNRRSVEILDYQDNNNENTISEDLNKEEVVNKGKDLLNKIFSSRTGKISVYVFIALNVVAIATPLIMKGMETKRRKSKRWNFKF